MNKDVKKTVVFVALIAGLVTVPGQAQKNDRPEMLLEAAKQKAILEGDCKAAIKQYKDIATRFATNNAVAATALLRMADCYRLLNDAEWRKTYHEVISKYPDQKGAAEEARVRLGGTAPREAGIIWSGSHAGGLTVSPDGRYIIHSTPMQGRSSLVVHDLSSGADRTLDLGEGYAGDPFITPDSKRVLYTWYQFKEDVAELRIVNLDGTGMRSLIDRGYVAYEVAGVTADGKLAAVKLGRKQTWEIGLLSLETTELKPLKNLGWRDTYVGNFSPDGRWLVYTAQVKKESPEKAVYVIATDGSVEYPVVPSFRGNEEPLFTPDGSRVLFSINRSGRSEFWSVRVKDGKPVGDPEIVRQIAGIGRRFAPDGTFYYSEAVSSSSEYVVQVNPSTWKPKNAPARISDPFRYQSVQAPHWSPDGKRLAYVAGRVVIYDSDSGQDRELPARAAGTLSLKGWFADGKSLQAADPAGLRLVDTETQQERLISTGARFTIASADGKAVFYATFDSAPYEEGKVPASDTFRLRRRDLDTGADKELFRAPEASPPSISLMPSPDGRSLAFEFARPGERQPRLWILPLSGGEPRELLEGLSQSAAWTQDSRAILFVRADEIWVQPIDGREPYATGITSNGLWAPSVSPDGGRIAFRGSTSTTSVWMIKNLFPDTSAAKR